MRVHAGLLAQTLDVVQQIAHMDTFIHSQLQIQHQKLVFAPVG
jgi:hypothetical protein